MSKRKPDDIMPRLLEWQRIHDQWLMPRLMEWQRIHDQWRKAYDALDELTGCGTDAPLPRSILAMWEAYTEAVAREVGDTQDWLDWYCYENDMGAKGFEVHSESGKVLKVKTIAHLAKVICY